MIGMMGLDAERACLLPLKKHTGPPTPRPIITVVLYSMPSTCFVASYVVCIITYTYMYVVIVEEFLQ